jgi:hypothetical protein
MSNPSSKPAIGCLPLELARDHEPECMINVAMWKEVTPKVSQALGVLEA